MPFIQKNLIEASGRITDHGVDANNVTHFTLLVNERDLIRNVRFSTTETIPDNLLTRDKAHITGHVRVRKYQSRGRDMYATEFIADSVTPASSEMRQVFGVDGHYPVRDFFAAYLTGIADGWEHATNNPRWYTLPLHLDGEEDPNAVVRLSFFSRGFAPRLTVHPDDRVYVTTSIYTKVTTFTNGMTRYFSNLTLEDLYIAERHARKTDAPAEAAEAAEVQKPAASEAQESAADTEMSALASGSEDNAVQETAATSDISGGRFA